MQKEAETTREQSASGAEIASTKRPRRGERNHAAIAGLFAGTRQRFDKKVEMRCLQCRARDEDILGSITGLRGRYRLGLKPRGNPVCRQMAITRPFVWLKTENKVGSIERGAGTLKD